MTRDSGPGRPRDPAPVSAGIEETPAQCLERIRGQSQYRGARIVIKLCFFACISVAIVFVLAGLILDEVTLQPFGVVHIPLLSRISIVAIGILQLIVAGTAYQFAFAQVDAVDLLIEQARRKGEYSDHV